MDAGIDAPPPQTDAKSVEELHAVVRYVRRERDVAELRLELSRQQEARMRQQLEQANKQLDEKSLELLQERQKSAESMSAASQHAELIEKVQALNLLRESNETLRRESEKYLQRAISLEQRLSEAEAQLSPLREQVRVFQAEMDAKDRNIKLLEDDNARWKTRTQQILQKYERIDPAELAQLKEELEAVKTSLADAHKERDAALSRVTAVSTDLSDANTRVRLLQLEVRVGFCTDCVLQAEANQTRFKSLQQLARKHRDDHKEAMAQQETLKATLQAEIDQLAAAKAELEEKLRIQQTSSSASNDEALDKLKSETNEATSKLEAEKQEATAARDEAVKQKDEIETARKKLEDDLTNHQKRNSMLLNDNKKFRSRIQELEKTATETLEAEVQKRLAELPTPPTVDANQIPTGDEKAIKAQLAELEERLTKERDSAVQSAVSETVKRLQAEFEQERAKFAQSSSDSITAEGSLPSDEDTQKRIQQAIQEGIESKEAKLRAAHAEEVRKAVEAKEAEVRQDVAAKLEEAKSASEKDAQKRIAEMAMKHRDAMEKLQKENNEKLNSAVAEAKANASGAEEGETTADAADVEKAVNEAVAKKDEEHAKALAERISEVEKKAKQEYDLKSKLRESQITALRKEVNSLKAKQQSANGDAAASGTPSTSAFPPAAGKKPSQSPSGTPGPASVGTPIKGLSIAGRSQSQQGAITRAAGAASPAGAGLSIAGSAAAAANNAADGSPASGRGRGRGRGAATRGSPAAGRGRGGIVNAALTAATADATGGKRAREDEGTDSDAKRRKDGESAAE